MEPRAQQVIRAIHQGRLSAPAPTAVRLNATDYNVLREFAGPFAAANRIESCGHPADDSVMGLRVEHDNRVERPVVE